MAINDGIYVTMVHPEHQVFCVMPHPPPRLEPTTTLFIYILYKWQDSYHKNKNKLRVIWTSPTSLAAVFHIQVRPKHGPLAYKSSSSAWSTWTLTVSTPDVSVATVSTSSSICFMGQPQQVRDQTPQGVRWGICRLVTRRQLKPWWAVHPRDGSIRAGMGGNCRLALLTLP